MDAPDLPPRGTWSHFIATTQHLPTIDLPIKHSHIARLYCDKAKRVTPCVVCRQDIHAKEDRLVFGMIRPVITVFPNGGKSRMVKCFAHPDCIRGFLDGKTKSGPNRTCLDCVQPIILPSPRVPGTVTPAAQAWSRGGSGYVCSACAESGRWAFCASCRMLQSIRHLSPTVLEEEPAFGIPADSLVCDGCERNYAYTTVRSITRAERADKRFAVRLEQAMTQAAGWFGGKDAKGTGTARKRR